MVIYPILKEKMPTPEEKLVISKFLDKALRCSEESEIFIDRTPENCNLVKNAISAFCLSKDEIEDTYETILTDSPIGKLAVMDSFVLQYLSNELKKEAAASLGC